VRTAPRLHIEATDVLLLPVVALALCICCAVVCFWTMMRLGGWYVRVDVAPWWLLKATTGDIWPGLREGRNASKSEFAAWCDQLQCVYLVETHDDSAGRLRFDSAVQGDGTQF
jgi:hypothetical protein